MQPAQQKIFPKTSGSSPAAEENLRPSTGCSESRGNGNEIGVINGVRKVLVPVGEETRQPDFDLEFDEIFEAGQLWIEVAPPGRSVALLLNKKIRKEKHEFDGSPVFLNCEDFQRTYNELLTRGAKFLGTPARMPFGWLSVFEDCEGRRFVLGQW